MLDDADAECRRVIVYAKRHRADRHRRYPFTREFFAAGDISPDFSMSMSPPSFRCRHASAHYLKERHPRPSRFDVVIRHSRFFVHAF
jgi:hypothetical protein